MPDNKTIKKFLIAKSFVNYKLNEKRCRSINARLFADIENAGQTATVLFNLLMKEADIHNTKIDTAITKLSNLQYKNYKSFQSKLLIGHHVPYQLIDTLIDKNPDLEYYEIFKLLKK